MESKSMLGAKVVVVAAVGGALLGCAHPPPPQQLIEARSVYARASAGPAAKLAPARLKLARQALAEAELAYGAVPIPEVQDRAYIAVRKAEAAEAEASAVAATERRMTALRELATLTGVHADRARAELGQAEQRANEAGERANAAQALAAVEQSRAAGAEQAAMAERARANDSETRLAAERQARTEAEARAEKALSQLAQMAEIKQEPRGVVITLSGQVLFVTDQAQLLPAAQASLENVATALKQVPPGSAKVTIEGHTDSVGPREYNLDLARRRAESVREFLVSRGVRSDLFTVAGVGPDRPVANNRTAEGRANNRRVEIVIPQAALALDKLPMSPARREGQLAPASATERSTTRPGELTPASAAPRPVATPPSPTTTTPPGTTTAPGTATSPASTPTAPAVPPPASPSPTVPGSPPSPASPATPPTQTTP